MTIDMVEIITERESRERKEREKKKWFEMMEGEEGANICRSCPSIVEDRSGFALDDDVLRSVEVSVDFQNFLEDYFRNSNNDSRYKKLFLAYFDLSDDNVVDVANNMGLDMDGVDDLINNYLLVKIRKAAEKSPLLR